MPSALRPFAAQCLPGILGFGTYTNVESEDVFVVGSPGVFTVRSPDVSAASSTEDPAVIFTVETYCRVAHDGVELSEAYASVETCPSSQRRYLVLVKVQPFTLSVRPQALEWQRTYAQLSVLHHLDIFHEPQAKAGPATTPHGDSGAQHTS